MFEILLLSLIQGLTEFLPVSSSSHLILISNHLNFTNQSISIDVSLHIGSFIAVVTYFFNDIKNFIKNKFLFAKIIISSIPVMIVGFFLIKTNYIDILRSVKIIGWTTVIFGVLLFISDKFKINKKISKDFTFKTAVFIGILQILSLVPGVSRSGITITAARFLNFNRFESAKISFLLSIPTLAAVSIFGLKEILYFNNFNFSFLNLIAIFLSFIFSFITIKFFLNYIKNFSLNVFVAYRIAVGLVILYFAYL
jgi:undecaprenyl-diphosphatase